MYDNNAVTSPYNHPTPPSLDNAQLTRMRRRGICVVIPTYNNQGTIANIIERTKRQCLDVIVVNDGSTDDTSTILSQIKGITVVTLKRNSGKGSALRAGFRHALKAGFAYAITLDADSQHFPEDIPLMLRANIQHPGALLIGERQGLDTMERSSGSKFANAFSNFWFCVQTGILLHDTQTGFRLYPLHKLHGLCLLTSRYEAELELLVFSAWHGVTLRSVPVRVDYPPKEERVSHFRPVYDFTRITLLNTVLCFLALLYGLPLRLLRIVMTAVRTVYSLLFFFFWTLLFLLPCSALVVKFTRNKEQCTRRLHRLLHFIGQLVMRWHGIPGVKIHTDNSVGETYERPAVVICNHQSTFDLMAMLSQSPRLSLLTNDWVWNSPYFGFAVRHAEYYNVTQGIDKIMPDLRSLVERGYSIAIYPEGTRSPDCTLQRFRKGAFAIARELHLDIVPLLEYAPGRCLPKGGKYLRRGIFHVEVGRRIPYEEYSQQGEDKDIASWFRHLYAERYAALSDRIDQSL